MNNKKIILSVIAAVLVVALLVGGYFITRPETQTGSKTITVTVVHGDGSTKDFTYHTDEEYLGAVLLAEGLAEGEEGPYGLYIKVVDGEKAVYEEDNAYWSLYIGEEAALTGADQTPVTDGGIYKLVYTPA